MAYVVQEVCDNYGIEALSKSMHLETFPSLHSISFQINIL